MKRQKLKKRIKKKRRHREQLSAFAKSIIVSRRLAGGISRRIKGR
jgi:hypothetical protein